MYKRPFPLTDPDEYLDAGECEHTICLADNNDGKAKVEDGVLWYTLGDGVWLKAGRLPTDEEIEAERQKELLWSRAEVKGMISYYGVST